MRILLVASFLLSAFSIHSLADHGGWSRDKVIGSMSERKWRSQETFDTDVYSIRSELEKTPKDLSQEKLDNLSSWAARLLAGQKIIKNRLEDLGKDPETSASRKSQAASLVKLYDERVETLEKLLLDISNY